MARTKSEELRLYSNAEWDLVDSLKAAPPARKAEILGGIAESELPPAVAGMSPEDIGKVVKRREIVQRSTGDRTTDNQA